MKTKTILSIMLCFVITLCMTSCSKQSSSSNDSEVSSNTPALNTSIPQTQSSSSLTNSSVNFTSIKEIEFLSQDIPSYDCVYTVKKVITDIGTNITSQCDISCDVEGVRVDNNKLFVPQSLKNSHDSITFTVRHTESGIQTQRSVTFESWDMIFEDEFEGAQLDSTKWEHSSQCMINKGYANRWSDDMAFVDGNGHFISRAQFSGDYDSDGRPLYYSGAIQTKGLFSSTYGYYEARVKVHHAEGLWGAFWLQCGDMESPSPEDDDSSVNGAEIDIFESLFNRKEINHAVHWDGYTGFTKSMSTPTSYYGAFDNNFHTFGMRWTDKEYIFYIDGLEYYRTEAKGGCNQPGYMLLSTECGTWGGTLDDNNLPSDMIVDYVRVWQSSSDAVNN